MYSLNYFVSKFTEIPEECFTLSSVDSPMDVWEWCNKEESEALYKIVKPFGILLCANDGDEDYSRFGNSPKQRVINFLQYIKVERGQNNSHIWGD